MTGAFFSTTAASRVLAGVRPADAATPDALARTAWSVVTEPGDGVAGRLLAAYGAVEAADRMFRGALTAVPGVTPAELRAAQERWEPRVEPDAVRTAVDRARRSGVRVIVPGDPEWPARVDDLGEHAPHALWARGRLEGLDDAPAVAIVGARAATGYGDHVTAELAAELAADGITIVSGAAYGIDGVAHRSTLAAGGRTVALLAGGIDRPYPSGHAELLDRIGREGAVVGETPCGTSPTKWRFLARNRLIAALADATVVVEAGLRSGSLNTAAHAASLGRGLGAVPGPVTSAASAGCHRILRSFDGVCVTGADDVREMLGLASGPPETGPAGPSRELLRLLDAASTRVPRDARELARLSGLGLTEVEALIGIAQLEGSLRADGRSGYRRAPTR
ncbi:DNA-processing protein DprA [Microbacterium sp. RD1]|uniref:DNA-processing protein DprA n=1 Tax=Microbacterium sp. RD1 TaxID=3457313 RepID=UPI003FA5E885